MSQFSSTVSVLAIENEERKSSRTGKEYTHFAARCVLLDDAGKPVNVGALRSRQMMPELRDKLTLGTFRVGYSIMVPDFGDSKGDILPVITSLVPVDGKPSKSVPAGA